MGNTLSDSSSDDESIDEMGNEKYHKIAGTYTAISAWSGLSSPLSGIKNLFIQIPRNMAL